MCQKTHFCILLEFLRLQFVDFALMYLEVGDLFANYCRWFTEMCRNSSGLANLPFLH